MDNIVFQHFIDLIAFDQSLTTQRSEILKLRRDIDTLTQEQLALEYDFAQVKHTVDDMRKKVDFKELEMRELDEAEKAAHKRLDAVSNQKEYQSIKQEIEQLKRKQHGNEDDLIAVWNNFEAAQAAYKERTQSYEEQTALRAQSIEEKRNQIAQIQAELDNRMQERTPLEQRVPAEWIEHYNRMRELVDDPVVKVVQQSCGACFNEISSQDMSRLRHHALVTCKGCFRLLYMDLPDKTSTSELAQ